MATDEQHVSTNRVSLRRFRFSIRALLGLFVFVSLLIVTIQFAWPRRTVTMLLPVRSIDVQIYEQHLDAIANSSDSISTLRIDRRTNSIIVTAQARNTDVATRDIEQLIADPRPVFAAASLGVTIQEARDLLTDP